MISSIFITIESFRDIIEKDVSLIWKIHTGKTSAKVAKKVIAPFLLVLLVPWEMLTWEEVQEPGKILVEEVEIPEEATTAVVKEVEMMIQVGMTLIILVEVKVHATQ